MSSGAIGASAIIRIDEVVSVEGILTPTGGSIEVKAPAGGLVNDVYVGDGDKVQKDDLLLTFDTRKANEQLKKINKQLTELKLIYASRDRAMGNRKNAMEKKYETNKKILKKLRYLEESGAIDENSVYNRDILWT